MASNSYEESARLRKVSSMVGAIDRAALAKNINPHTNPARVLEALEKYTEDNWKVVDKVAGLKNKSSQTTREAVKQEYGKRIQLLSSKSYV